MTLNPRRSPAVFSALCASLAALVFLALPVEVFWPRGLLMNAKGPERIVRSCEAYRLYCLVLMAVRSHERPPWFVISLRRHLAIAGLFWVVGAVCGRAAYWCRCERRSARRSEP